MSSSTQTSSEISKSDSFTELLFAYKSEKYPTKAKKWEKKDIKLRVQKEKEREVTEESKNFLPRTRFQTGSEGVGRACHHLYYQSLCCPGSDGKKRGPSASCG